MQLASILSDLTSLQVCDPAAALALVSVRASHIGSHAQTQGKGQESATVTGKSRSTQDLDVDADMQRAMDLLDLHENVKVQHVSRRSGSGGEHDGLLQARRDVDRVTRALQTEMMEKRAKGKGQT